MNGLQHRPAVESQEKLWMAHMGIHEEEPSPPSPEEDREQYCSRLEASSFDETQIRKALRRHFEMSLEEMGDFFENYPEARIRHLTLLKEVYPQGYNDDDRLARKVSRDLGISRKRAEHWVKQVRQLDAAGEK